MSGTSGKSREGNRTRSLSESDSERISDASFTPEPPPDHNPGLISNIDSYVRNSNPNLTTNPGVLLETPVGVGMGTRLQLRKVGGITAKQEKALKECESLIKEIDKWLLEVNAEPVINIDKIYEGAESFKKKVSRVSQEALIRLVDRTIVDKLASRQISVEKIRKKAEREERKQNQGNLLNPPPSLSSISDQDDTFQPAQTSTSVNQDNNRQGELHNIIPEYEGVELLNEDIILEEEYHTRSETDHTYPGNIRRNSVFGELESSINDEWKVRIEADKRIVLEKIETCEKNNQRIVNLVQQQVFQVSNLEKKVEGLTATQHVQGERIESIERRVEKIDRNIKGYVDNQVNIISKKIEDAKLLSENGEISTLISNNVKELIANSAPEPLNQLKREIANIKHKVKCDNIVMESMRSVVQEVKEQLDATAEGLPGTSFQQGTSISVDKLNRERDLTRNAIESSAKLLKQLVLPSVDEQSDLALIKKCNMDVKKVTSYSKTCHDLLMKYIAYEGMETDYYLAISTLLSTANEWIINVEQVYSASEAHAISSAKGNVETVGIFSDNASKTVYEFIEQLDLALTGWGSNTQRANELYHNHLSEDIKTKTVNISTSYLALKDWLISEFGSPDIIISDIITDLENKRKPSTPGKKERYQYFLELSKGLARLDKLSRVPNIDIDDVESILYSRTTYNSLFKTLPTTDLDQFRRFMKARKLDWKKPVGIRTFSAFKEYCTNERDIAEDFRSEDNPPPLPTSATGLTKLMG